jgi:hypothetical protein
MGRARTNAWVKEQVVFGPREWQSPSNPTFVPSIFEEGLPRRSPWAKPCREVLRSGVRVEVYIPLNPPSKGDLKPHGIGACASFPALEGVRV